MGGGGVDGAIHRAGGSKILEACKKIRDEQGECPTGEAVITTAGKMPSKYVIHTVGPVWKGGQNGEPEKLRNCYLNALKIAESKQLKSVAFPNISTGVYGYPKREAAEIAIKTIEETKPEGIEEVLFVCFDEENYGLYEQILQPS